MNFSDYFFFHSERIVGSNNTYTEIEWPVEDYDDHDDEGPQWNCMRLLSPLSGMFVHSFILIIWSLAATTEGDIEVRNLRNTLQAVTRIDLGAQTQLLANPGSTVQIYYEITNLRDEPTFHNFQVVDEQRFLRALTPQM